MRSMRRAPPPAHGRRLLGAIDQGTTSTRFLVFDRSARIIARAQRELKPTYPAPGRVEFDPERVWRVTQAVITQAMRTARLAPNDLAAIGIANQRESTVLWDRRSGRPIAPAIGWQDTRTTELVADFSREGGRDRFRAKTGLPLSPYFSALKIRWLLEHVPRLRDRVRAGNVLFGNVDAYLTWKLTGGTNRGIHVTDVTNASRTQLVNLTTLDWDDELLGEFGIPSAILPTIRSSSEVYGAARLTAVRGVPIAGILGDQQAALVGQACLRPGETKNTYGTGCFLLMNTGETRVRSKSGLLTTVAYQFGSRPATFALEGSIALAGGLVEWVRDNLGLVETAREIESLARTVKGNGGVYFVPAFSGLYAPHWAPSARGAIVGLTHHVTRAHLARAVLEATGFQTREVLEAMEQDSETPIENLRVDGGMASNDWLMQFQSDILNRPVVRPVVQETTALGAAYAAGLATGVFHDPAEFRHNWIVGRTWRPTLRAASRERLYSAWKRAVQHAVGWSG